MLRIKNTSLFLNIVFFIKNFQIFYSSFAPRKKRSKVTDSSRINKIQPIASSNREVSSLPNSARSSPQVIILFRLFENLIFERKK